MGRQLSRLERELGEITATFFQAKLGVKPRAVHVLEEEEGDLVVIKVGGFLTKAEAAVAQPGEDHRILDDYYSLVLERLFPLLSVVVEELAGRTLLGCRTALDLPRDECLYLLTLGAKGPVGNAVPQTLKEIE